MVAEGVLSEETATEAKQSLESWVAGQIKIQTERQQLKADHIRERQQGLALADSVRQRGMIAKAQSVAKFEQLEHMKSELPTTFAARQSLGQWLEKNRLSHHELAVVEACGVGVAVEDLPFLSKDDLELVTAKMTATEARRFAASITTIKGGSG